MAIDSTRPPKRRGSPQRTEEARLKDLASRINRAHERLTSQAIALTNPAVQIGGWLIEAKKLVGHGPWLKWIKANCSFERSDANINMRYHEQAEELGEYDAQTTTAARDRRRPGPSSVVLTRSLLRFSTL
jgi:hypothetical protein